ncbi:5-hydroxytryptamine receptor 1D-like [Liolophura sinensis]|uniref:5-hydroxytryptamine receptor 1D-like n=1 Tax=Liolophura sinensis TaxID=3198878 RepID=UPI0031595696
MIVVCSVLGTIILGTILGNIFVISAILLEKSLRATSNYLILSLAVTDLMVAVLVMPISILNQISTSWRLGTPVCDMWISFDILCCTASILHLVAIALDRYWSVTNVDYTRHRSTSKILLMIVIVWCVSFSISVPPLLGWRDSNQSPEHTGYCLISQDPGYTIFSTVGAFYIPLMLILALNLKIYRVARKRFKKRSVLRAALQVQRASITMLVGTGSYMPQASHAETCRSDVKMTNTSIYVDEKTTTLQPTQQTCGNLLTVNVHNPNLLSPHTCHIQPEAHSLLRPSCSTIPRPSTAEIDAPETTYDNGYTPITKDSSSGGKKSDKIRRFTVPEIKKEKRTASVLGIITGAFILCWLPFFIVALIKPFCQISCVFPDLMMSLFVWLGYFNSMINPIIYTVFNPNFRLAFRKLLCGRLRIQKERTTLPKPR